MIIIIKRILFSLFLILLLVLISPIPDEMNNFTTSAQTDDCQIELGGYSFTKEVRNSEYVNWYSCTTNYYSWYLYNGKLSISDAGGFGANAGMSVGVSLQITPTSSFLNFSIDAEAYKTTFYAGIFQESRDTWNQIDYINITSTDTMESYEISFSNLVKNDAYILFLYYTREKKNYQGYQIRFENFVISSEPETTDPTTTTDPIDYSNNINVDQNYGYNIYAVSSGKGINVISTITMVNREFGIAYLDSDYEYTVLNSLMFEPDPKLNPHLLADTYLLNDPYSLENLTLSYTIDTDEFYIIIYSLDVIIDGEYSINAGYELTTNVASTKINPSTKYELMFPYTYEGTIRNNKDEYWDSNEWNIYKDFTINAGEIIDIMVLVDSGQVGIILFGGNTIDDINEAIDAINIGDTIPDDIYQASISKGISYISYRPTTTITANLAIFTNSEYNPYDLQYLILSSISSEGGPIRTIAPIPIATNVGDVEDYSNNSPSTFPKIAFLFSGCTLLILRKKKWKLFIV